MTCLRRIPSNLLRGRRSNLLTVFCVASKSSHEDSFDDPGVPRVALCKDGQTICMYHPRTIVEYEKTIPIPRDDPRYSAFDNVNTLVKHKLDESDTGSKPVQAPAIEHGWPLYDRDTVPTVLNLAEMFHTSKHMWFVNKKKPKRRWEPPVDRPFT